MLKTTEISKAYNGKTALAPTTLEFLQHSFTCIVGRSGCGKTTLLRLLCGLEKPDGGSIAVQQGMRIAPVFQEPRLLPWLTVAENITLAARHNAMLDAERLSELIHILGLEGTEYLYPRQLSGGMAQRVALGRTLFFDPDILLMDEPFSALDYFTRQGLQKTLLQLHTTSRKTIVFVTHDVEEALLLGDRVLVMEQGCIKADLPVQLAKPREAASTELQELRKQILDLL